MSTQGGSIDDPAAGTADPFRATRSQDGRAPAPPESARCYLMVFESRSATMVPLPSSGEFLIGRGHEAHLRIRAPAASQLHLKLVARDGAVQIADLSRHGTRVNGAPLCGVEHRGFAALRGDHPVRHGKPVPAFLHDLGMWWAGLLTSLRERAADRPASPSPVDADAATTAGRRPWSGTS